MLDLFNYNWQVRNDWFAWCDQLSIEDLLQKRAGGLGSILHTLFHVIDGEQIWLYQLMKNPVIEKDKESIKSLEEVIAFSEMTRNTIQPFLADWSDEMNEQVLVKKKRSGDIVYFPYKKVLQHVISHEIHHIGQLSIWSREMGLAPVNSDLIIRTF
ncbi:DinB family protein [Peribacillus deserti]|uniref:DNA damage-inducible protein DinB n=1 Tax=Peribacillus deserti TaxID=673318 RepID=A0A2N5M169_9BACI|nr:DinB family protein [Peribacillus deserti]PLT28116.1 DNA damage-inducible protein DinB [Peribacillus deserti]